VLHGHRGAVPEVPSDSSLRKVSVQCGYAGNQEENLWVEDVKNEEVCEPDGSENSYEEQGNVSLVLPSSE